MARRPFDPSRAVGGLFDPQPPAPRPPRPPEPPAGEEPPRDAAERPAGEPQLTVTEAARLVDAALQQLPRPMAVVGQVSGFTERRHWYFSLKDEESVISCVMWESRVGRRPRLADGDEVVARGSFGFWSRAGRTQFIVESVTPRGMGSLEQQFRALCEELRAKGWFEESRKPRLPSFPRRIAIVTSATGAAVRDCLATAASRCPAVSILVVDVRVQGEGAAAEVAEAIRRLDLLAEAWGIDAILVTRGGGSREELWAFNERVVAEAAFRCRTPLVAAIGHEPDVEIIELVAHRAATPTRGIMLLLPDREALRNHLDHLGARSLHGLHRRIHRERGRLELAARHALLRRPASILVESRRAEVDEARLRLSGSLPRRLEMERRRLAELSARMERHRPSAALAAGRARLEALATRLPRAHRQALERRRAALDGFGRQLAAVGPAQVLARGYSLTLGPGGRLLRRPSDVEDGARIETRLAEGALHSLVTKGPAPDAPPRA